MAITQSTAKYFRWTLLTVLAIGASISLSVGIKGALRSSKDFQWAGSSLLRMRIDPWQQALLHNDSHIAHFSPPQYLHEFYVLLLPLSILNFQHAIAVWCGLNILLSIACIYLLRKLFLLSSSLSIGILLLLWMSAPYRTTLQVGQMSMMELFLLCIVFCTTNSTIRGLALGLSFSKYNFAPVVVSLLWFKHNIRTLTIAAIVAILGLLLTWGMLGGSIVTLASEPFAVADIKVWPGMADVMTSIEAGFGHWMPALTQGKSIAYGIGLLLSCLYGFFLSRRRITDGAQLTLVAVASLFTVKHLMYDYVFLVVPLCYAASERGKPIRSIAVPIIGVFWFMDKLFPLLPLDAAPNTAQWLTSTAGCCMLGTLLAYLTWSILRIERSYFARRSRQEAASTVSASVLTVA